MNERSEIWNICSKAMDALLLFGVPIFVFPVRKMVKYKRLVFALSFILGAAILYGLDLFSKLMGTYLVTLFIAVGLLYAHFLFEGRFYLKVIIQSASICCSTLMHFIIVDSLSMLTGSFMLYTFPQVLAELIAAPLLALLLIRVAYYPSSALPVRYGITMISMNLILVFIMDLIRIRISSSDSLLWICVVVLVFSLMLYYLFFSMIREYEGNRMLAQQIDIQKRHLEESTETFNEMKVLSHELKNHAFYMRTLIKLRKYDQLDEYFEKLSNQVNSINAIESGNRIINALLNQKIAWAKSKGIQVDCSMALPETLCVDESHVCAIISNLFDNAIEACKALPEPRICLILQQNEGFLHITCKNTAPFDVLKANASLITTKEQPSYHGIGLRVVKSIADMYEGMTDFYMEDGLIFVASVLLESSAKVQ